MNAIRKYRNTGFTLVEILIVVIILGILAAIVIPQFTNASQSARENSLMSQLQTVRSQIELFKLQHGDQLPALAGTSGWSWLTQKSNWSAGTASLSSTGSYGPYLQQIPTNSLNGNTAVLDGDGTAAPTTGYGWVYDYTGGTGKFWATGETDTTYFDESNPTNTTGLTTAPN